MNQGRLNCVGTDFENVCRLLCEIIYSQSRWQAGADESVRLAADYVQTQLSKLRIQKPEIIEGPIKAHD